MYKCADMYYILIYLYYMQPEYPDTKKIKAFEEWHQTELMHCMQF